MNDPTSTKHWYVNVAGREFGPYTLEILRDYATQGRITAASVVKAESETVWIAAIDDPLLGPIFERRLQPEAPAEAVVSNFVIVAELRATNTVAFDNAMSKFGESCKLCAAVSVLRSAHSLAAIRNQLVQVMGKADSLVVIDGTTAKAAWFNLGPEVEARLRQVWRR